MTSSATQRRAFPAFDAPALTFDDLTATVGDLVRVAAICGDWESFTVSCARHQHEPAAPDESRAAAWAEEFRRARHLEAAADLEAWLWAYGLDVSDFRRYARSQGGRRDAAEPMTRPVAWWPEVVFSGAGRRWSRLLGSWLATGGDSIPDVDVAHAAAILDRLAPSGFTVDAARLAHLAGLHRLHREWRERLGEEPRITAQIASNRLQWTRVDYAEFVLPTADAGRELALCINEDGLPPAEAAARAGCRALAHSALRAELAPRTVSVLGPLRRGEASAPAPSEAGFTVLVLLDRRPPMIEDPSIRALALESEAAQRLDLLCAGRVREHWSW